MSRQSTRNTKRPNYALMDEGEQFDLESEPGFNPFMANVNHDLHDMQHEVPVSGAGAQSGSPCEYEHFKAPQSLDDLSAELEKLDMQ